MKTRARRKPRPPAPSYWHAALTLLESVAPDHVTLMRRVGPLKFGAAAQQAGCLAVLDRVARVEDALMKAGQKARAEIRADLRLVGLVGIHAGIVVGGALVLRALLKRDPVPPRPRRRPR